MNRFRSPALASLLAAALAACGVDAGTPAPARQSGTDAATATAEPTASASVGAIESASPEPSVVETPASPADTGGPAWTEAATFGESGLTLVSDVSAWDQGFLAIGHAWTDGYHGGPGAPLVWSSSDGRSWTRVDADFGTTDVELRGILPMADGRIALIGEQGARAASTGDGTRISAAAWLSGDALTWEPLELPFAATSEFGITAGSGPLGHVVSTGSELWYSADALDWQRVHEADGGRLQQPVAGEEGFVVTVVDESGTGATVLASGDGVEWLTGTEAPATLTQFAPLGPDWLSWSYTQNPSTISVFTSANGLEWSVALDVNTLTPEDGPKAGQGMESEITEATILGAEDLAIMTLGWNHCCVTPPAGVGVWTSADGRGWARAALPEGAYVTAAATDGEVTVVAGHLDRGARASFWVADR